MMKRIATLRVAEVTGRKRRHTILNPLRVALQIATLVVRRNASGEGSMPISQMMMKMTRAAMKKIQRLGMRKYSQALALVQQACKLPRWSKLQMKLPKEHRKALARCRKTS